MALVQQRQYSGLRDLTPYRSNFFMICAILSNIQAPQSSFLFYAILGIHLLNMGVKRRCIALLHELGITVSWTTLAKIQKELEEVGRVRDFTLDNFNKVARALQAGSVGSKASQAS